ncbi:MAG: Mu-like prophage major head subunit gpT family protein [Phycisphaerae bacterium]|nr:Mu-like prophage major head subunit gpT family protein [Phycisphaerae bacterium]MCZ2399825.1 Mu-like prophage major head subunit gpT family protein [Phycisphaerae bacterium]NUQ49311.1 Mu-like prophage major head subunit gpT family protein [Phycisphaerae bacterium]
MSVVIDTGLTSRAVIGRFYRRLEEFAQSAWWTRLAMRFASSQESETYRWLGMVPQVREWKGGRQIRPLRSQGVTIVNKVWESTIRIDADEQRRDKSGQIMVRVNEMARRVATHPNKLLSELIEGGASGLAYDGAPFFSTSHSEGDSGTQSNSVTYDAGTPTAPTDAEMYGAIVRGIAQILSQRDDQGEPMNESAREFMVMVPMSFLPQTLVALSSNLIDSSSNPLAGKEPFGVSWVANPRLTWTDKFAVFRTDGEARPFIFQEELPVQLQILAEGSELEANENQHQYGVKAIHEAGYGFWQDAALVTLT